MTNDQILIGRDCSLQRLLQHEVAGVVAKWIRWYIAVQIGFLLAGIITVASAAETDTEWAEWTYKWEQVTVILRTNAGVYSPKLQALGFNSKENPEATRPANLIDLTRTFFVFTSSTRIDNTFEFIEPLAQKWGPGHVMPILAAVVVENAQRPIPTLFGGPVSTYSFSHDGKLKNVQAGGIDPKIACVLRITVHGDDYSFRRAAEHAGHASANAYYDGGRNEVGLLLDMPRFRRFYSFYDQLPGRHPTVLSAFIAYAMDTFNEDSGHELAHAYQQQTRRSAYALPAIREGEAEVQGMTRRRNGLRFNFLYNTPDAWYEGKFDRDTVMGRLEAARAMGIPMTPIEVDRLATLKKLHRSGHALSTAQLLGMDAAAFFSGSSADVELRYAQAWSLCLLAIRDPHVSQTLIRAIDARVAKAPLSDLEKELDNQVRNFIEDPYQIIVTKEDAWMDAERFFGIDPVFAGLCYAWIHIIDPSDMKVLIYIGDALYKGGNLHGSMRYYLAAQKLGAHSALPLLRIGDVQDHMGDREAAVRSWRQAEATTASGEYEVTYRSLAKTRQATKPVLK